MFRRFTWPISLDLLERLASSDKSGALKEAVILLCPSHDCIRLISNLAVPTSDNLREEAQIAGQLDLLVTAICSVVRELPKGLVVDLGDVSWLTAFDLALLSRIFLIIEPDQLTITGFSRSRKTLTRLRKLIGESSKIILKKPREPDSLSNFNYCTQLIATSPRGVPSCLLAGMENWDDTLVEEFVGPDNETWVRLRPHIWLRSDGRTTKLHRRLSQDLFERWPVQSWGYVRRLQFLLQSSPSFQQMREHFCSAFLAFELAWRNEHLRFYVRMMVLMQLRRTSDYSDSSDHSEAFSDSTLLLARVSKGYEEELEGARRASRAARIVTQAKQQTLLLIAAANLYARMKSRRELLIAESMLQNALTLTEKLSQGDRHLYDAHCLNALALVEYHRGNNLRALGLERRAASSALGSDHPEVRKWADTALNLNFAKLYETRFDNMEEALQRLATSAQQGEPVVRLRAILESARIEFSKSNWQRCLTLVEQHRIITRLHPARMAEEIWLSSIEIVCLTRTSCYEKARQQITALQSTLECCGLQIALRPLLVNLEALVANTLTKKSSSDEGPYYSDSCGLRGD